MTTEERLENLERELKKTKAGLTASKRRNRWMLGGVALLILGCLAIAATPGNNRTIRANTFILEDANGKPRASMSMDKDGPSLVMCDANGKTRAGMSASEDGSGLVLADENGNLIWGAP